MTRIHKPSTLSIRLSWSGGYRASAFRWTLIEFLGLVVTTACAAQFAASGSPILELCVLTFVVCTRIGIVDYSLVGTVATAVVMPVGIFMIFLGVFWMLG